MHRTDLEAASVKLLLEACYNLDQAGRQWLLKRRHPLLRRGALVLQHGIDKGLRLTLSVCIKRYGWITQKRFGDKAATTAFLIVQHAPKDYIETHIGLLREAVCAGDARRDRFAMMQDRLLMYRGKKQIYGTQFTRAPGSDQQEPWPIVNIKAIEERRRAAGFSRTFAEYTELMRNL